MTPQTSETTLLLGGSRQADQSSWSLSKERFRFSAETLLIPVALATKLAALMPSTTYIEIIRRAVCRVWNSHPAGGPTPNQLCSAPEIEQYYSIAVAILGATEGILSVAGCGILSRISCHYGRKPALLLVLTSGVIGRCLIPMSHYTPDWLADWAFLVGTLLGLFSGALPYLYLVNMYIVDVCIPEDRTAALSKVSGWVALGTCISYALGGYITTKTGNTVIVFYMSAVMFFAIFVYVVFVLPESFPKEKRDALSRMRSEHSSINGRPTRSWLIFEPLRTLVSTRGLDGTRNWRLVWCAAHTFVFMIANSYVPAAWMVVMTSKYGLTPADTGLFLTIISVSGTVVLMLIVPLLVRFLRPLYSRRTARPVSAEEGANSGEELQSEISDDLDVHLAIASCVAAGVFYLSAAASMTDVALIISAALVGFSSMNVPTIRSLAAGSVDPLKQGEALAAIEIVSNTAAVLSPILMGSILTATINTIPLLMFYIHLVVVLLSSGLLFFVRDADGYREASRNINMTCDGER